MPRRTLRAGASQKNIGNRKPWSKRGTVLSSGNVTVRHPGRKQGLGVPSERAMSTGSGPVEALLHSPSRRIRREDSELTI